VTVGHRRTSVSLEDHVWDGLTDVCRREAIGIDTLCTAVDRRRSRSSMSSALRVFLLLYFRTLAEARQDRPDAARHDGGGHLEAALDRFRTEEAALDR
jgi:predicted DNA-binding ribbon-helix-helix protein